MARKLIFLCFVFFGSWMFSPLTFRESVTLEERLFFLLPLMFHPSFKFHCRFHLGKLGNTLWRNRHSSLALLPLAFVILLWHLSYSICTVVVCHLSLPAHSNFPEGRKSSLFIVTSPTSHSTNLAHSRWSINTCSNEIRYF